MPWVVNIQRKLENGTYVQHCTGSIITNQHIVSAAHCFHPNNVAKLEDLRIVIGIDDLKDVDKATIRNIVSVKTMPKYQYGQFYYDVAVVQVESIKFNKNAWPICLPTKSNDNPDSRARETGVIAGWGKRSSFDEDGSSVLLSTVQTVYRQQKCDDTHDGSNLEPFMKRHLPNRFQISVMCAENENGREGSCRGDSGGPFSIDEYQSDGKSKFYLIGIVTGVIGGSCGYAAVPDTFNRIEHSDTYDWIKRVGKSLR